MADSVSQSSGSSSSSSVPGLINSPQSDWELQLAQYLQQVGNQQMQWAQQEYARAGAVTDAQINNYISTAQQGSDLAGNVLGRYNSLYGPQADQYAREAGSYASNERLQHEMGRAESGVMQAGNAAQINAEQQLQGFGVDPSSGRYADLIRASKTADAAAAAGAGEQARRATEMEGTRRKETAMNYGAQLPAAGVNALNSAYQGIAGAENAALGLANTGVNLTTSASKFYDPAMGLKYPPVGQNSQSASRQGSTSVSNPSGGAGAGGSKSPSTLDRYTNPAGNQGGYNPMGGGANPNYGQNSPGYSARPAIKQVSGGAGQIPADDGTDPNAGVPFPYPTVGGQPAYEGLPPEGGNWTWGDSEGASNTTDSWAPSPSDETQGGQVDTWGAGSNYDETQGGADPWGAGTNSYGDQNYGSSDLGSSSGSDDYYAGGGGVIPSSMSPSGGQQTDDVPAHIPQTGGKAQLNVNEFVIPQDVALWKGQEFFQNMIKKSREARMGAQAKPSRGRP
jgi:hypothetical protein